MHSRKHSGSSQEKVNGYGFDQKHSCKPLPNTQCILIPGPHLELGQCGLPRTLALQLYSPFLHHPHSLEDSTPQLTVAPQIIRAASVKDWDSLERYVSHIPVILSFPTQEKMTAIQVFEPLLIDGNAIQIHPAVAQQLNIDFSGQTAHAYVPLSRLAQEEALQLAAAQPAFVNYSNGHIAQSIPNEACVGLAYLMMDSQQDAESYAAESLPLCANIDEIRLALDTKRIRFHDPIRTRLVAGKGSDNAANKTIVTTAGRILFNALLPPQLPYYNQPISISEFTPIIEMCRSKCGRTAAIDLVESLSKLGLEILTFSGLSLGKQDWNIPTDKHKHLIEAVKTIEKKKRLFERLYITHDEMLRMVEDEKYAVTDNTLKDVRHALSKPEHTFNLLRLTRFPNAYHRLRQLCGMFGFAESDPASYKLVPLTSNYGEGVRAVEYLSQSLRLKRSSVEKRVEDIRRKSRKLTKSIVARLRSQQVTMSDCGTLRGVPKRNLYDGVCVFSNASERVVGRVAARQIVNPKTGKVIVERNQLITVDISDHLRQLRLEEIEVRSPITCQAAEGVCQLCFGIQPSSGSLPTIGEKIGMQAALAVADKAPHMGELVKITLSPPNPRLNVIPHDKFRDVLSLRKGYIRYDEAHVAENRHGEKIVISHSCPISIIDDQGETIDEFLIPYATVVNAENHQFVFGNIIAGWTPAVWKLIASCSGEIQIENFEMRHAFHPDSNIPYRVHSPSHSPVIISIVDDQGIAQQTRFLYDDSLLFVQPGTKVEIGDVLAEWRNPTREPEPRTWIAQHEHFLSILEKGSPTLHAVMADFDGVAHIQQTATGIVVKLTSQDGELEKTYEIPREFSLYNGYCGSWSIPVRAGDLLSRGEAGWTDVERIQGPDFFQTQWLNELLLVYHMNNFSIAEQYVEMLL